MPKVIPAVKPQRAFKGIWIPAGVWLSPDLSITEKVFLVEIDSLSQGGRACFASNNYFAAFFGLTRQRCSQIIAGLIAKGYLTAANKNDGLRVIERQLTVSSKFATLSNVFPAGGKKILRGCQINAKDINTVITTKNNISQNSIEFRLSLLLFELIKLRKSDFKKPDLDMWVKHVDRMLRLDGRTPEKIETVIRFSQADDFWQNNILSTEKLRRQFDQLELKMNSAAQNNAANGNPQKVCVVDRLPGQKYQEDARGERVYLCGVCFSIVEKLHITNFGKMPVDVLKTKIESARAAK